MFYRFGVAPDDANDNQPNWCVEFFDNGSELCCTSSAGGLKRIVNPRVTLFLSELPNLVQCYPALSQLYRATTLPSTWCSKCGFAEYPSHFCDKPGCAMALCRPCRQRFLPMSAKEHEQDNKCARFHFFSHHLHKHSPLQSELRFSYSAVPTALIVCYTMEQADLEQYFDHGLTSSGLAQWGMGLYVFNIWVESTTDTEAKVSGLLPVIQALSISQAVVVWFGHNDPQQHLLVYESANAGATGSDSWASVGKALAPVFRALQPRVALGQQHDQTSQHRSPLDDIGLIVMTCEARPADAEAMLREINGSSNEPCLRDIISFRKPINIEFGRVLLSRTLLVYTNYHKRVWQFNDSHQRRHPTWLEALRLHLDQSFIDQFVPFKVSARESTDGCDLWTVELERCT